MAGAAEVVPGVGGDWEIVSEEHWDLGVDAKEGEGEAACDSACCRNQIERVLWSTGQTEVVSRGGVWVGSCELEIGFVGSSSCGTGSAFHQPILTMGWVRYHGAERNTECSRAELTAYRPFLVLY